MSPLLSIITVTKNAAFRISLTLRSIQEQSFRDYEHWIIDGLSSDDTLKTIKKLKNSKLKFISEKDKGIYDAMNKGAHLAKGEYLLFLNAGDHLYENDALKNIFKELHSKTIRKKNDKKSSIKSGLPDLILANIQTLNKLDKLEGIDASRKMDQPGKPGETDSAKDKVSSNKADKAGKEKSQIWRPTQILKHPHTFQILPHSGVFIKRDFFLSCGGYNIKYKIAADIEFFNRALRKHRASCTYLDRTVSVFYRDGISSSFWGKLLAYKEELRIHWQYYGLLNTLRRLVPIPYLGLRVRLLAVCKRIGLL